METFRDFNPSSTQLQANAIANSFFGGGEPGDGVVDDKHEEELNFAYPDTTLEYLGSTLMCAIIPFLIIGGIYKFGRFPKTPLTPTDSI